MTRKADSPADLKKRVGIWIRVSTEDQARGESPQHHEHRARCYAEARGWDVREVYHLEAVSGKSVLGQPETQRMLAHLKAGHISGLIFSKLARLARNTKELLDFADIFRAHQADLVSLQEAIDTSTPAGRLFYTLIAAMAQWEREEIAERVAASVPVRAQLGKPLGGAAPFGYRWHERRLVPDPAEAPVRREVFTLFLQHRRKKTVARLLNQAGHRTRNGSRFSDTTVDRLLRDPTAKGLRRANYTKSLGERKHWVLKPEDQWVFVPVDSIVDVETWQRCNDILDQRRQSGKPLGRKPVHLFAGRTECVCGGKMYVPSNTPKYVCYRCRNKIPVVDLETVFQEQLRGFFFSPDDVASYLQQADQTLQDKEGLLQTLVHEADKLRQEMDKVYRLYVEDQLPADRFGTLYRPLTDRQSELDQSIPTLQAEVDFLKIRYLSRDQVISEARALYDRWSDLTIDEKREIVETITERIVVDKTEVTIELGYVPSSSEIMAQRQHNFRGSSRPPG